MRTPPLLADFTHTRVCKPICAKLLTLPDAETLVRQAVLRCDGGVVLMIVSPEADALLEVYRGFTF